MHSLCFSGVHCIICDVRFQMEKNIQASETAGGASLAVDLPECSFFIIPISVIILAYIASICNETSKQQRNGNLKELHCIKD